MSDSFQSWLEEAAGNVGIIACAVRRADRTIAARSCRVEFPEPSLVDMVQTLAETIHLLQQNRIIARNLRFAFDSGQLRCVIRDDGALAVLVTVQESNGERVIEQLLARFLHAES